MSNRTDFDNVAHEVVDIFVDDGETGRTKRLRERIALELHNAFVAGQEAESSPSHATDVCPCPDCWRARHGAPPGSLTGRHVVIDGEPANVGPR